MPPVTVSPWREVLRADTFGPVCPQNLPEVTMMMTMMVIVVMMMVTMMVMVVMVVVVSLSRGFHIQMPHSLTILLFHCQILFHLL